MCGAEKLFISSLFVSAAAGISSVEPSHHGKSTTEAAEQ